MSTCSTCSSISTLHCIDCNLLFCYNCITKRHNVGKLIQHKFTLIATTTGANGTNGLSINIEDRLCWYCKILDSDIYCEYCDVKYCKICLYNYHELGNLKNHILNRPISPSNRNLLLEQIRLRDNHKHIRNKSIKDIASLTSPISNINSPALSPFSSDQDDDDDIIIKEDDVNRGARKSVNFANNATLSFRISNFGLFVKPEELKSESANPLFFCIDRVKRTFSLCEKILEQKENNGKLKTFLSRPTKHIKSVAQNVADPKIITIYFHIAKQPLELYAPTSEEAETICLLLQNIADDVDERALPEPFLYACRGFKKGSLQWAERWLILKRRTNFDSTVPVNTLSLMVSKDLQNAGNKVIVITTPDREFSFKLSSGQERDTFFSLLEEASSTINEYDPVRSDSSATITSVQALSDQIGGDVALSIKIGSKFAHHSNDRRNLVRNLKSQLIQDQSKLNFGKHNQYDMPEDISYKVDFVEEDPVQAKISYIPPPRNDSSNSTSNPHMTFWLLKIFGNSIAEGAYLTPTLFLSRQIWLQHNAKFLAYQPKKEAFTQLHTIFSHSLKIALVDICIELENIQNALCVHLSHVPEIKKKESDANTGWGLSILKMGHSIVKRATRAVATTAKVDNSSEYIHVVREVCIQAQTIDAWISHFESTIFIDASSESILLLLAKVTEFLQTVFLGTIIRDMKMLLHRYSKHCSRSLISAV